MTTLFTPITLRKVQIPNRIGMAPMCQFCAASDGLAHQWHRIHYASRAIGGVGLILVEATGVAPEGRITPTDLGLWSDDQMESLRPVAGLIREYGSVAGIQLGHAGRKGSTAPPVMGYGGLSPGAGGWEVVAPSALPFKPESPMPRALTAPEIEAMPGIFARAAERALAAGFQVVEVHAAHGYLLHQFLSPLANRREDAWGGSWENRVRLPLAVVRAVRAVWPADLPMLVRISATDWVEGGWDLPQSVALARAMRDIGVDLIDCSTAGMVPEAPVAAGPGFQVPFAGAIRREVGMPVSAVGLITEPEQAATILAAGDADMVLLGRVLLRQPYWPLLAAAKLQGDIRWPSQYVAAK